MDTELVRYSRAGDVFHYRWAARRCLALISPKTLINSIVIEGSNERNLSGEYVIDVAEYSQSQNGFDENITYFQLKHTTKHKNNPFMLNDLRNTFEGFAKRYNDLIAKERIDKNKVKFAIVTNRPISDELKSQVLIISRSEKPNKRYMQTLLKYTNLNINDLNDFCSRIIFMDGEGDYDAQKFELHAEISLLTAGIVDIPEVEKLTSLVQQKALPDSNGVITREEILKIFHVTSERDLFPAPPEFEKIEKMVMRKQHSDILEVVMNEVNPVIIHAPGGSGKTVFARQFIESLPNDSVGIIYDCFGGGRYRNRSETRHHHRQALTQMINELSMKGYCDPLIVNYNASERDIIRKFLERLEVSISRVKLRNEKANLVLIIDAADNAEMAATEFNDNCFVNELLREHPIADVKVVALCRSERLHMLKPKNYIKTIELKGFTESESFYLLKNHYPYVSIEDGIEFHRLTNGNPRVQSNALGLTTTISDMFNNLGSFGTTVDEQIESQLSYAIDLSKDKLSDVYQQQIDLICTALATLPPFIPINILSKATGVEEGTITSFVSDIGKSLWITDNAVQFRDEPTETWFKLTFAASSKQISFFLEQIKSLSYDSAYIASALPSLMLQAGKYSELVELALSDRHLPKNPIDERNVRLFRLQFAFKASMKEDKYSEAIKLAMRAGEEFAGNSRQLDLIKKNVDLVAPLQDENRVQELAYKRLLNGDWKGSENVYSAALLSTVNKFNGESRSYLRGANNWLKIYFENQKVMKDDQKHPLHNRLKDEEIFELTYTHLNLFGVEAAYKYLMRWTPDILIYNVSRMLINRLIDFGEVETANSFAKLGLRNPYIVVAFASEVMEIGYIPDKNVLNDCLELLINKRSRIPKRNISRHYDETMTSSLISFAELCAATNLPKNKVIRLINYYFPSSEIKYIVNNYNDAYRSAFLRSISLKMYLLDNMTINSDELVPSELIDKKKYTDNQDAREIKELTGGLLPWYLVRIRCLINHTCDIEIELNKAQEISNKERVNRYKEYDVIPREITKICCDILIFHEFGFSYSVESFFDKYIFKSDNLFLKDILTLVRAIYRLNHLSEIRLKCEQHTYQQINSVTNINPEEKADFYIKLARAVMNNDMDDAAVYFDCAINALSKFGDELVERWESIVSLANIRNVDEHVCDETAYRFIRCAELIGESVEREKYWNRNEAIKTCARLSPASAIAALSRWRDREVGNFNHQLVELASELVSRGYITPEVGWSLSSFMNIYDLENFALLCLDKEEKIENRTILFNSIIKELRINGAEGEIWTKIKEISTEYSLNNELLDDVLLNMGKNKLKNNNILNHEPVASSVTSKSDEVSKWSEYLQSLNLESSSSIKKALIFYRESDNLGGNRGAYWNEIYRQVPEATAKNFIYELIQSEEIDFYDLKLGLELIPEKWLKKVSVKKEWPHFMEMIGNKHALYFLNKSTLSFFVNSLDAGIANLPYIEKGVIGAITNHIEMVRSSDFFGIVDILSNHISTQEATKLLDYSLYRLEMYIDPDYSDGLWSPKLFLQDGLASALTGFIWSALGSPKSSIRWCAAHSVKRLAEFNCENEIDQLINWMEKDTVGAFGNFEFPFYNLHARLFLLISFARISKDKAEILLPYTEKFRYFYHDFSHFLIQKYSADILLNIGSINGNEFEYEVSDSILIINDNELEPVEENTHSALFDSDYKEINQNSLDFHHGYDFERYWFESLESVFNIANGMIARLASNVIINDWNIDFKGDYLNDPRQYLWRMSYEQENTYHSHGNYPSIETYSFYLSFHSMFNVIGKIINKIPFANRENKDKFEEWLDRHLLTRNDGYWLYDRRDPIPLASRGGNSLESNEYDEINDFLEGIFSKRNEEIWLNVFGTWTETEGNKSEEFNIASSLVSAKTSDALLNALTTCSDPYDFKLPEYQEERMEINSGDFNLKGWVYQEPLTEGADYFDPHSKHLLYPAYKVGDTIAKQMNLYSDLENREWREINDSDTSVNCEMWAPMSTESDENYIRRGKLLSASLSFLKKLCKEYKSELIIEIQIRKKLISGSYQRSGEPYKYEAPHNKLFILSADGRLRDSEKYHKLW
ncbi:ATP-binding protein [Exiguobacterium sp. CH10]|uniref:ATP-binding protein n=1 Tax=Exiguobacterium sp. CH10 TaxID=2751261 RepID=UPI001BEC98EF|nr:ATP-binding protein [Exiguobacterium sp. CH10]